MNFDVVIVGSRRFVANTNTTALCPATTAAMLAKIFGVCSVRIGFRNEAVGSGKKKYAKK